MEAPSLGAYVDVVLPHAPERLIGAAARSAIGESAAQLPAATIAGFERALGGGPAVVDMAMCVEPGGHCANAITHAVGQDRLSGEAWRVVQAVLSSDLDDEGRPAAEDGSPSVQNLWLEFDISRQSDVPSVFVTPVGPPPVVTFVDRMWPVVASGPPSSRVRAHLETIDASGARLVHAAHILSRQDDAVRLCLSGLSPAGMRRLLTDLGQQPSGLDAAEQLAFGSQPARMILALDVDAEGARPRFGIEFQPPGPNTPRETWWEQALDALVTDGLCTKGERDDLLRWPGKARSASTPNWPSTLEPAQWGALRTEPEFERGLHHLKLGFAGSAMLAKVYFGFILSWQPMS